MKRGRWQTVALATTVLLFIAAVLVYAVVRMRANARLIVRSELASIVSAVEPLPFLEQTESLVGLGSIPVEPIEIHALCSWLSSHGEAPESVVSVYPKESGAPNFVHAYVPDPTDSRRCSTDDGLKPLLPALYVVVHPPFATPGAYTYLKISLSDGSDEMHFGARIIPIEHVRSDTEFSVIAYQLKAGDHFADARHAGDNLQRQWRSLQPAERPLKLAMIRLRLRPPPSGKTEAERYEALRLFASRKWTITAEMQRGDEPLIRGQSYERRRQPLSADEIATIAEKSAGFRCMETRIAGTSEPWRQSPACLAPSNVWGVLEVLAAPLVSEPPDVERVESSEDGRALEIRIPAVIEVRRLAGDLGVVAAILATVLGIVAGTWAYLRSHLRGRVQRLAAAAQNRAQLLRQSRDDSDLLRPLELVILREREQSTSLERANAELTAQSLELEQQRAALEAANNALTTKSAELEQKRAALEAANVELTEQSTELEQKRSALEAVNAELTEQSAELVARSNLAQEHARAFHSTAGAFRHELSDFVASAILVLQAGPLASAQQDYLLKNAKLAQLIIRKIAKIRHREPLESLPDELTNVSPEWVPVASIFDWWLQLIDPGLVARISLRGDRMSSVWAAIGPVVWIMMRFSENAFRHGIGCDGGRHLRVGTRRLRSGFLAITFANRTRAFEQGEIKAMFDVNRNSIQKREGAGENDLSGVGLYAARQYAVMTEGMVDCRYRAGRSGTGVLSFSVLLKVRQES